MPQQANIVINDGQSTPVAHTFEPNGSRALPDGKVKSEWVDRSVSYSVGRYTITEYHAAPNGAGIEKIRYVISRPTMQVLSSGSVSGIEPIPGRAFETVFDGEFRMPNAATDVELKDIAAFAGNFLSLTSVKDKVVTRASTW